MKRLTHKSHFLLSLFSTSILLLTIGLVILNGCAATSMQSADRTVESGPWFDMQGSLMLPQGYRRWVYVGTPVTPNDLNGGKAAFPEFHIVYMNPSSFEAYKQTGKFPDSTILVKELVGVGSKRAVSGNGYFMGEYIGLEAAVKDSKRFPNEPGNWAYFSFTAGKGKPLKEKAEALSYAACNSCHQASAQEDWVFTQYYPVLRAVKKRAGSSKSEDLTDWSGY